MLLKLVATHGKQWRHICLPTRDSKQCRERYENQLSGKATISKQWGEDDVNRLVELVEKFGRQWSRIADEMNRTAHAVKVKAINLNEKGRLQLPLSNSGLAPSAAAGDAAADGALLDPNRLLDILRTEHLLDETGTIGRLL